MSKIVRAVNTMILNKERISDVIEYGGETYFLYNIIYKWSIRKSSGIYFLTFYPEDITLQELIQKKVKHLSVQNMVYNTNELKTREAEASFAELYILIREKLLKVDEILEDIIEEKS